MRIPRRVLMVRKVIHTSGRRTGLVIGQTGEGVIVRGPQNWGERLIASFPVDI